MYLEANNARPGALAELLSPTVDVSREGLCLRFWYNMYGNDMGTLLVYARVGLTLSTSLGIVLCLVTGLVC